MKRLTVLAAGMVMLGFAGTAYALPPVLDSCTMTSGNEPALSCPASFVLIRLRNTDGSCTDWMCCHENSDGKTVDCEHGASPAPLGALGSRSGTIAPPAQGGQTGPTASTGVAPKAPMRVRP